MLLQGIQQYLIQILNVEAFLFQARLRQRALLGTGQKTIVSHVVQDYSHNTKTIVIYSENLVMKSKTIIIILRL